MSKYIPARGDIVKLDFDPILGREQAGYRPAVIITQKQFNQATRLAFVCPITSQVKGYPFEVAIAGRPPSVVLADQVKSQDWGARRAERKGRVSAGELFEVRAKLKALIG